MCHVVSGIYALCFVFGGAACLNAQETNSPPLDLPECDIFLFEFAESESNIEVGEGQNITNRPGYDNQPWFSNDGATLLYSANAQPDRTDIFEYSLSDQSIRQVTDTKTQEYSPQSSPDKQTISFVTDGPGANQSIWFQQSGAKHVHWLLSKQPEREPVGYYVWNHQTDDILFWSRYGFSLRLVNRKRSNSHYITGNAPPVSPHIIPGTNRFSFVHRQGNGQTWIKELDPSNLAVRPIVEIQGSNLNYAWSPSGKLLQIKDNQLQWWSATSGQWQVYLDLEKEGVVEATRISISPDGTHLAIVGKAR